MISCPVKISVIIPVYNVEKYLCTCLTSCVQQTLTDVEFICVNDGSTDSSLQILQEFAENDFRFKIIDKPNGGPSSARNAGLRAARGEYIMFLDSDDYLEPNACERVWIEKLEAPTDIVIFSSHIFPHDHPCPSDWYYSVINAPTRRYWEFTPQVLFQEPSTRPFLWHQAFRKEILDKHGIEFLEGIHLGEDMLFLLQVYPHAKNFCFLQDQLYHYRWYREGSLMWQNKGNMDERIHKHINFVKIICDYWQEQGWFDSYGKEFLEWMLEFIVGDIRDKQTKEAENHLQKMSELIRTYNLDQYLNRVSSKCKIYVHTLKKGRV